MRFKSIFSLSLISLLTSCSNVRYVESNLFYFDTSINIRLYDGNDADLNEIKSLLNYYDKVSDNYHDRDIVNIRNISSNPIEIDEDFYQLLKSSIEVSNLGANNFNVLAGSLAKKWKESLANKSKLNEEIINEELDKINNSKLILGENNTVSKLGEAEIDLGGVIKGYVIDRIYDYLNSKNEKNYLINAGNSSILVGEKPNSEDGNFIIRINDLNNTSIKLKNSTISTSSTSIQGVKLDDGNIYSHIVNPTSGSAINNYDAVIVISSLGYLGDALSTSMMMNSVEEIKNIENNQGVYALIIKDKNIVYCNENINLIYG